MMAQGVYDIPRLRFDAIAVMTNTAPVGAFRGAGRPEAAALLERIIDIAADELGHRARRRSAGATSSRPTRSPTTTLTGVTYDNGDYDAAARARRCGSPTSTPPAPSSGAGIEAGERQAARHRHLDVRRDHRLRRLRVRPGRDPRRRLGDRDVRHLGARPGPRHVVLDDRRRPARHPAGEDQLRAVRHRGRPHRRRHRRLALAAARRQRRRQGGRRAARARPSSSPPGCSRPTRRRRRARRTAASASPACPAPA